MGDKRPTEAQIKKFWEWCGLVYKEYKPVEASNSCEAVCIDRPLSGWYAQDGKLVSFKNVPIVGLNNLFKYAVPVAIDRIMAEQECGSDVAYAILFKKWLQKLELDIPNHEGTLYWSIWEVINE